MHRDLWKPTTGKWRKVWMGSLEATLSHHSALSARGVGLPRLRHCPILHLLSLVPILAIIFAVAKGFGLAAFTEEWIRSNVVAKPEIIDHSWASYSLTLIIPKGASS